MTTTPTSLVSRSGRAFTLVEVLVAIGAVAIVAVGLAAIFDSVGKTVSGGRRVSLLNQYGALIESRMRRDFDRMTRDGVLVIRQQWSDGTSAGANPDGVVDLVNAPGPDRVRLHASQPASQSRARRMDEIVFFVRDRVRTARQPLHPGVIAQSDEARIYYGHAMRYAPPNLDETDTGNQYFYPNPEWYNNETFGSLDSPLGKDAAGNPNRFASEWILLRHQTLLVNPETSRSPDLTQPVYDINPAAGQVALARLRNSEYQIALQPAAASIFRAFTRRGVMTPTPDTARTARNSPGVFPRIEGGSIIFTSGIVDIATSDLDEVRAVVNGMASASALIVPGSPPSFQPAGQFVYTPAASLRATNPASASSLDRMHDWMEQLLPTESDPLPPPLFRFTNAETNDPYGSRIRGEGTAPGLVSDYIINAEASDSQTGARARAIRHADQLMLEASNFVPRCSEFIVEWSFGVTDAAGDVVWYGPNRYADSNRNGAIDAGDRLVTAPYGTGAQPLLGMTVPVRPANPNAQPGTAAHFVTPRLVYGFAPTGNEACLTSYFGYVDPTFNADPDGDGQVGVGEPMVRELAWAWPRMIRVTVTIADPADPSVESTFQYVFSVPDGPDR